MTSLNIQIAGPSVLQAVHSGGRKVDLQKSWLRHISAGIWQEWSPTSQVLCAMGRVFILEMLAIPLPILFSHSINDYFSVSDLSSQQRTLMWHNMHIGLLGPNYTQGWASALQGPVVCNCKFDTTWSPMTCNVCGSVVHHDHHDSQLEQPAARASASPNKPYQIKSRGE